MCMYVYISRKVRTRNPWAERESDRGKGYHSWVWIGVRRRPTNAPGAARPVSTCLLPAAWLQRSICRRVYTNVCRRDRRRMKRGEVIRIACPDAPRKGIRSWRCAVGPATPSERETTILCGPHKYIETYSSQCVNKPANHPSLPSTRTTRLTHQTAHFISARLLPLRSAAASVRARRARVSSC